MILLRALILFMSLMPHPHDFIESQLSPKALSPNAITWAKAIRVSAYEFCFIIKFYLFNFFIAV